jgi:acyl phosphate:glycerol-3-phosphate acyltransferase
MIQMHLPPELLAALQALGWISASYLLGSFPVAWLLARWVTGRDLREMGSGNVGVMNTALSVHRWTGLLVFLTEITKGVLVVLVSRLLDLNDMLLGMGIVAVVVGTRWPVWLGFKGGRGNTAGMAACLAISYQTLLVILASWALARFAVKKSFIATRLTLISLPFSLWLVNRSWWFALTGLALSLIYLNAQQADSDDHLLIQQRWSSFWSFLTSPPRR